MSATMENETISFTTGRIAEDYAKRPWFHKQVMEQIKRDCQIERKFLCGLDVGCGAGLSTKALYPYDMVTAAGVINWVDREQFLDTMNTVMAPGGLLVIYDFWITDRMAANEAYTDWYQKRYLAEFPKPPRQEDIWQQSDLDKDFIMEGQVTYEMQHTFDMHDFIAFMMIQSNVNVQIESGEKSAEEVEGWMKETLSPIFGGENRTLLFESYNWYIRRKGQGETG